MARKKGTKQTGALSNSSGAVYVTVLLAIPLIVAVVLYVVSMFRTFHERALLQEMADASAIQAAAVQARGLNALALLNDTLLGIEGLAAGAFIGGHSLGLALDALLITAPEGVNVHIETMKITDELRKIAGHLAEFQDTTTVVLPFLPLAASQLPLFTEPDLRVRPVLLPYPVPGWPGNLQSSVPAGERAASFDNFGEATVGYATKAARESVQKTVKKGGAAALKACKGLIKTAKISGRAQSAAKRFTSWLTGKNDKPKKPKQAATSGIPNSVLLKGCKEAVAMFDTDSMSDKLTKQFGKVLAPPTGQEFAGFPFPLVLDDGYSERYQIGVIALDCSDCKSITSDLDGSMRFAVSQARPVSFTQNKGGDLLMPDFRARLVPVTLLEDLTRTQLPAELKEALWVLH